MIIRKIAVLAAALVAVGGLIAPVQAADIPAPGEIVMSPNIEHVTNVPKPPALRGTNTDMAFQGDYAYVGNFGGFSIYDIKNPEKASTVSSVVCPGGQMDISVHGVLLFGSVDYGRDNDSCASTPQPASVKESWEGIRIFDVSDKANPKYIKSIETSCGSHTHTLVPDRKGENVYVYVSSYFPNEAFPDCQPPHNLISIIKVPLRNPTAATVIATPNMFPDGGYEGVDLPYPDGKVATSGCHDITVYPEKGIAAAACMGDGLLLDIRNPEKPRVTATVRDEANFAFWHSATFNNEGTKVIFTDELGAGSQATCNDVIGPNRGANAYYDITRGKLVFKSYFKIARPQADTENCVAHNSSLIPVKGRDVMVQAWYQGGISVIDFTDSSHPEEIAYFERGPDNTGPAGQGAGFWSAYWYNGYIYGSDFNLGLDVLKLDDRRTNSANGVKMRSLNPQTQASYP